MDKSRIITSFEELFTKYKDILSLRELVEFSKQITDAGYHFEVKKEPEDIKPEYTTKPGLFDSLRRIGKGSKEIELSPGQDYMYRWKQPQIHKY